MGENKAFPFQESDARRILGSKEGRALLKLLNQDGGAMLRQAAAAFQSGDMEKAKQLVTPLMESSEAQALIKELNRNG